MSHSITYVLVYKVSLSSRRTMHHLHEGQAEEFLYHPQADPPPTQQQRPSLIRIHILRQLFLEKTQIQSAINEHHESL